MSHYAYLISANHHTYKEFENEERAIELTEAYLHGIPDVNRDSLFAVISMNQLSETDITELQEQLQLISNSDDIMEGMRLFV
jgi:hypothetical protein